MYYQLKLTNYLLSGETGTEVNRTIYDSRIDELSVYDAKATIEVNAAGQIQFTIAKKHPYYDDIKIGRSWIDFVVCHSGMNEYILGGCVSTITSDLFGNKTVTVYGAAICLHDVYMPDIEFAGGTFRDIAEMINEQIAIQTVGKFRLLDTMSDIVQPFNLLYGTAWDVLNIIRESFTAINVNWQLYIGAGFPEYYLAYFDYTARGQMTHNIKAGTNLIEYVEEVNESDIYSGINPLGAETGVDFHGESRRVQTVNPPDVGIVWDNTLVEKYGRKIVQRIYDDITTASALTSRATSELYSLRKMKKKITVKAVDIDRMYSFGNGFKLMYSVIMEPSLTIPQGEWFYIKRIDYDLNNPANDVIQLTNYV